MRNNWLYAVVLLVGVVWWTNTDRALLVAAGLQTDWPWATFGWAFTGVGAAAVVIISYVGIFPVVRHVRDADMGAEAVTVKMFRYHLIVAAFVFCVVTVLCVEFRTLEIDGLITLLVFAAIVYTFSAPLAGVSRMMAVPDDVTRERLDCLCDYVSLSVSRTRLLGGGGRRSDHLVRGPVGWKTLFPTDLPFDRYDDEAVSALSMVDVARLGRLVHELRLFTVTAVARFVVWGVGQPPFELLLSLLAFAGTGAVLLVTGEYASKRLIYRADEAAAERVGRVAVTGVLVTTVDEVDPGRTGPRLSFEPSLAPYVEWLRDGSGVGEADV